jgi:hypothetical protein
VNGVLAGAAGLFALCASVGCGGGSSTANQVAVTVTGPQSVLVPKQSEVITATVTGATDVSSSFDCTFTTTPDPTTATPNPTPSAAKKCDDPSVKGAVGALSNLQNTSTTVSSTVTFTAPDMFPDHATFPNVLVTITATAHANTKKTGTFNITIDSGIRITLSPSTATLATGESKNFMAEDLNGNLLDNTQLTWGLTYETRAKTDSVSCSGGSNDCGSVALVGGVEVYTAPAKVPVAAPASTTTPVNPAGIVTIFVFSKVDHARIAQGSITIVSGGPITFSGLSPAAVPLGGPLADIFLNAPNITSQSGVKVTPPAPRSPITIDPNSNQIKVIFAAGSTTSSVGARVRLTPDDIPVPGTYSIEITANGTSTVTGGPFNFEVIRVGPAVISTAPDNFQESTLGQQTTQSNGLPELAIDGGYYGSNTNPSVSALFNNTQALLAISTNPRSIVANLPAPQNSAVHTAGLFPISVTNSLIQPPVTARTNVAIIPDYGSVNPNTANPLSPPTTIPLTPNGVPSAIALDSTLGIGAITFAGLNGSGAGSNASQNVQFFSASSAGITLTGTASSGGNLATSVAIDGNPDGKLPSPVAVVVNYADRTFSIINIPSGNIPTGGVLDLSAVVPDANPAPFPYSVGVDPFLHRALVAFASTNIGLIVNLDPSATEPCVVGPTVPRPPYCPIGFVTLNTGAHPQIAFEPLGHIAYVTPGGGGILEGVDLSATSHGKVTISKLTRTANIVQVTTAMPHGLNSGVASIGAPTVLISGVPKGSTASTDFNGAFPVTAVLGPNDFTYAQADVNDTATCGSSDNCSMSSGSVGLAFLISPTLQGIAVNPLTRRLAFADPNVSSSQITFLDPLIRNFTSMSIFSGATGATFTGAPEIGLTAVGFQPYSGTAVAFNPTLSPQNQISVIDPSLLERPAFVNTDQTGNGSVSFPAGANPTVTLSIPGSLAVDTTGNRAIVVNAGSSSLSVLVLGKIKSVHIQELRTPDVPGTTLRRAALTTAGAPLSSLPNVKIFGTGFTSSSVVRLDGTPLASGVNVVNDHEIDLTITIPPALVGVPHRYAVDVVTGSVFSNTIDFTVIGVTNIPPCSAGKALPGGVAIDEQRNLALVTNTACAQVSFINVAPASGFGSIVGAAATGGTPTGVAVLPRLSSTLGVAVVTNNSSGTISILDLDKRKAVVPDITVGTNPTGVAINQQTNLAVIANTGSNSVSSVDLTPLTASPVGTLTVAGPVGVDQSPLAVAIDPDRGSNGRGLAVVTALQLSSTGLAPTGVLDSIDIGGTTPARSTTSASGLFLNATPTGVFFDPAATSGTTNPGLFFGVTSQSNQVVAFNPDTGSSRPISVGINPVSVALNVNSGTIVTVNASSNTISLVDAQTFVTREVIGIGGSGILAIAVHNFQNLAVVVDQGNNRVLYVPLP